MAARGSAMMWRSTSMRRASSRLGGGRRHMTRRGEAGAAVGFSVTMHECMTSQGSKRRLAGANQAAMAASDGPLETDASSAAGAGLSNFSV